MVDKNITRFYQIAKGQYKFNNRFQLKSRCAVLTSTPKKCICGTCMCARCAFRCQNRKQLHEFCVWFSYVNLNFFVQFYHIFLSYLLITRMVRVFTYTKFSCKERWRSLHCTTKNLLNIAKLWFLRNKMFFIPVDDLFRWFIRVYVVFHYYRFVISMKFSL